MSRRRHRRRNPSNQTLIYVGGALALLGIGWMIYQNSQNQMAQNQLPPAQNLPPTTSTDNTGQIVNGIATGVKAGVDLYGQLSNGGGSANGSINYQS